MRSGLGDFPGGDNYSGDGTDYRSGMEGAYLNSMDAIVPGVAAAAQSSRMPGEDMIDAVLRVATAAARTAQQVQLINQNAARAQAGQPPLFFPAATTTQTGMTPETQKVLLIAGGVGLAAYLMTRGR